MQVSVGRPTHNTQNEGLDEKGSESGASGSTSCSLPSCNTWPAGSRGTVWSRHAQRRVPL